MNIPTNSSTTNTLGKFSEDIVPFLQEYGTYFFDDIIIVFLSGFFKSTFYKGIDRSLEQLHRSGNLPAIINADCGSVYYRFGKKHRLNGCWRHGSGFALSYYLHGIFFFIKKNIYHVYCNI